MLGAARLIRGARTGLSAARAALLSSNAYADEMHRSWTRDPSSVDASWAAHFASGEHTASVASTSASPASAAASAGMASDDVVAVTMLIRAIQSHGHEVASLDPLGLLPTPEVEVLDPATYGFAETDWDRPLQLAAASANFGAAYDGLLGNPDLDGDGQTTMRELVTFLKGVYCGNIGSEYMHIAGLVRFLFILFIFALYD